MQIIDLITSTEELEPETLLKLFPSYSALDRINIFVYKLLMQSNIVFEDMDVFENAVYVLNRLDPEVDHTEGVTTTMLWKAISEIKKIRKHFEFSHEVLMYIKYISNQEGYYFYPEDIGLENKHLKMIKVIKEKDNQLKETFYDIQTYKYIKLLEEIK